MLRKVLAVVLICGAELAFLFLLRPERTPAGDAVAFNALVKSVEKGDLHPPEADRYAFTLLDAQGSIQFQSEAGLPADPLQAAAAGAAVLPAGDGLLIAVPTRDDSADEQRYFALGAGAIVLSAALMLAYTGWLHRRIVRPFRNIRTIAEQIAAGRLGFSLEMDRGGIFGPFTEGFDLMRSELARSRAAQARAEADKKDLIARLSHDLRTPAASIQAVAELGALAGSQQDTERFRQIAGKAVQLNILLSNLLAASLEDQTELTVTCREVPAPEIENLLTGADYLNWLPAVSLPACSTAADPVRLQQIFDNLFINAYKYGRAPVRCSGFVQEGELMIELEDAGGGVGIDETASLHLRSFRGRNAREEPGAGLGLYICDQLLQAMQGELLIRNGEAGLQITVMLPLFHPDAALRNS